MIELTKKVSRHITFRGHDVLRYLRGSLIKKGGCTKQLSYSRSG